MKITTDKSIGIETEWPARINVEQVPESSLIASVYQVSIDAVKSWDGQIVLVLKKESTIALFVARYPDSMPPEWWQDAEVIYEFRQPRKDPTDESR